MLDKSQTLSLVISGIRDLTQRVRAFKLRAPDGSELPLITAGSHIAIQLQTNESKAEYRQYAICSNPSERDHYEIAVLLNSPKSENEQSLSQFIFDKFNIGTQLQCLLPSNNFQLHADSSPAVLIAKDIGIAPIKSLAHTLSSRGRRFSLHFTGEKKMEMPFIQELDTLFPRNLFCYATEDDQHLEIINLLADAPDNAYFYVSGPHNFLRDIEANARLLGMAKDRFQLEYLSSPLEQDKPLVLELAHSNRIIKVDTKQSLLTALRDAGINAKFDCCVGECGTCAIKVLEGTVDHRDHALSNAQKEQGFMCVCVSRAKDEKLVLAI